MSFKNTAAFFEGYNAHYRQSAFEENDIFGPERLDQDTQEWDNALSGNEVDNEHYE